MIFKGKKLGEKIIPNVLYVIYDKEGKKTVQFIEKQKEDDSEEVIDIEYVFEKDQYGLFANEYHPAHVADPKKADLLLCIIDENKKEWATWILDIKVSVGGGDVITHLIEQWQASYKHKKMFAAYLDGFVETETIGVITRDYQAARIQTMVEEMKNEIDGITETLKRMPVSSNVIDQQRSLLIKKLRYEVLDQFRNGQVIIDGKNYPIKIYALNGTKSPYYGNIEVKLEKQ